MMINIYSSLLPSYWKGKKQDRLRVSWDVPCCCAEVFKNGILNKCTNLSWKSFCTKMMDLESYTITYFCCT